MFKEHKMAEDLIDLLKSINPAEAKLIGSSESYDDPIFTKEDLATAKDKLTLLARYLLIQEKVGFKKYNELYDKYVAEFGIDPVKANRDRGNYRKTLRQPSMTYKFFTNVIMNLLGYSVVELELKVKDKDGKLITLSSLTAEDEIPRNLDDQLSKVDQILMNVKTNKGEDVELSA